VPAGTVITLKNLDSSFHSLVHNAAQSQFGSVAIGNGQTTTLSMPVTPGTYAYKCGIHGSMTGTAIVE
jgi:plastocyanin